MIEQNRRFDIVVRLAEADRENLEAIRSLPVRVGDSGLLPLGDLADIQRVKTVSPILRDSAQRRAALMVNLRNRDVESWVREADAKVREHVKLPEGYTVEFGGQFENLREAKTRLADCCARSAYVHLRPDLHGLRQCAPGAACLFRRSAGCDRWRFCPVAARYAI